MARIESKKFRILGIYIILYALLPGTFVYAQCSCEVTCVDVGPPTWTYSYTTTGIGSVENFTISGAAGITDASSDYPFRPLISKDSVTFTIGIDTPCGSTYDNFTITAPLSIDGEVTATCYSVSAVTCGPYAIATVTPTPSPTPTYTATSLFTATSPHEISHSGHQLMIFLPIVFGLLIVLTRLGRTLLL